MTICLQRRELLAAAAETGQLTPLGASEHLVGTYFCALELGTFNATELAAKVGTSAQNVNNRLKRLVTGGALARRRVAARTGGKEVIYSVPGQLAGCDS